jgi:ADP-heptose:LPS heptosyltransferase
MVLFGRRIPSPPHQLHRFLARAAGHRATGVEGLRQGEALLDAGTPPRTPGAPARIGLAPHAKHRLKEWPFHRFLGLARLLEADGIETRWLLDPARGFPTSTPLDPGRCVRGPLEEVAREMALCDVVVSGDTGLGHLASALGLPVAVLYGSTVPDLGHTPTGVHTVVEVDLPCRPCHVHGASSCWQGHRRCLGDIPPELVFRQAKMLLHRFGDHQGRGRFRGNLA